MLERAVKGWYSDLNKVIPSTPSHSCLANSSVMDAVFLISCIWHSICTMCCIPISANDTASFGNKTVCQQVSVWDTVVKLENRSFVGLILLLVHRFPGYVKSHWLPHRMDLVSCSANVISSVCTTPPNSRLVNARRLASDEAECI